ncbi:MAG: NYN domain-containing protein [Candidatus Paceibacterota bacterium]|jgi:uncharacterized LabA/DUF88 family protein
MNLHDLKLKTLGIDTEKFARISSFIDYGNVNYWYDKDRHGPEEIELLESQKLIVDIEKLANFVNLFSEQKRFYYGWNPRRQQNWHIAIKAEKCGFIKNTKPMQFIRHYVGDAVISRDGRKSKIDGQGRYIEIPKSNFDVEISVDAIRTLKEYDTFCIFSGDSDFTYLSQFLKRKGKKIIVIASGQVFHTLKEVADLYINAQAIKADITGVKETTPR